MPNARQQVQVLGDDHYKGLARVTVHVGVNVTAGVARSRPLPDQWP